MDKQTLSHYGWIIVVVIITAVMISLATPFAASTKNNFISVVNRLTVEAENAMNIIDGVQGGSGGGSGTPKTVNEYGFYYEVPYTCTLGFGGTMTWVFLPNNTLIGYQNDGENYDVTAVTYGPNTFTAQGSTFAFSSDGLSFTIPLGTFIADLTADYVRQP